MRELSLFTGAGGGLLGTKLLGWEPVGYVEWNEYCQRSIAQRIKDGFLARAPIFCDIRTFVSEGYAEAYQGMVDVITAGFPCQPFSVAGRGEAENDERNMWPATIDVIRAVRPKFIYLENSPNLLTFEYARTIFRELAESGYSCRWRCLSAAEMGANHKRKRVWIVAYSEGESSNERKNIGENGESSTFKPRGLCGENVLANANGIGQPRSWWASDPFGSEEKGEGKTDIAFDGSRWGIKSPLGRVANGVADSLEQLKATGNGQVPEVVRGAWNLLT